MISERAAIQPDARFGIAAEVAFLKRAEHYPKAPGAVEAIETHLSWVFLTDRHAYKLKKRVRYPFLDFTTLAARRRDAVEEVRLNRRLAPGVYLGVVPLTTTPSGGLALGGAGLVVDWLVKMRRLPRERMLDYAIAAGCVDDVGLRAVARLLTAFYAGQTAVPFSPAAYRRRFEQDIAADAGAVAAPRYGLSAELIEHTVAAQRGFLARSGEVLAARVLAGRIVEGHGDLRPEHVSLGPPAVIIDCVEFNREFRIVDPADELGYLALECERLGAPSIGTTLLAHYRARLGDDPPERLIHFYQSARALLRAKLAAWHLDDATVPYPSQWFNRAQAYLALAQRHAAAT